MGPAAPHAPVPPKATNDSRVNFLSRFVHFWWFHLPAKIGPSSKVVSAALADGSYLAAWPRIGTALVVASFAIGLIEGIGHWAIFGLNGYGIDPGFHAASFAEMLPLMIVAVLVGSLSANLGLTLVLGFALGDFFIAGAPYSPWLAERIVAARGIFGLLLSCGVANGSGPVSYLFIAPPLPRVRIMEHRPDGGCAIPFRLRMDILCRYGREAAVGLLFVKFATRCPLLSRDHCAVAGRSSHHRSHSAPLS